MGVFCHSGVAECKDFFAYQKVYNPFATLFCVHHGVHRNTLIDQHHWGRVASNLSRVSQDVQQLEPPAERRLLVIHVVAQPFAGDVFRREDRPALHVHQRVGERLGVLLERRQVECPVVRYRVHLEQRRSPQTRRIMTGDAVREVDVIGAIHAQVEQLLAATGVARRSDSRPPSGRNYQIPLPELVSRARARGCDDKVLACAFQTEVACDHHPYVHDDSLADVGHLHPTTRSRDFNVQMLHWPFFRYFEVQQHTPNRACASLSVKTIPAKRGARYAQVYQSAQDKRPLLAIVASSPLRTTRASPAVPRSLRFSAGDVWVSGLNQ